MRLRARHRARAIGGLVAPLLVAVAACGETRLPIGEECLRGEDCLSGVCSARECVAAPTLVTGAQPAPDETARIPVAEGGADAAPDAPADAPAEGG
jgi:hypothetical protein